MVALALISNGLSLAITTFALLQTELYTVSQEHHPSQSHGLDVTLRAKILEKFGIIIEIIKFCQRGNYCQ